MSEWKVQDYILLILRIKEAELAELKCKMIFRLLCITEIPPLNHETEIVYIKAEDIIFCFYADINIFLNCYNHLRDYHHMTVFLREDVQRSLK